MGLGCRTAAGLALLLGIVGCAADALEVDLGDVPAGKPDISEIELPISLAPGKTLRFRFAASTAIEIRLAQPDRADERGLAKLAVRDDVVGTEHVSAIAAEPVLVVQPAADGSRRYTLAISNESEGDIDGTLTIDARPASDPTLLSSQGVYGDLASRALPSDAIPYAVNHDLWSDGAAKRRWLILPPGNATIDNTDQEHWSFPPGTRVVKEFTRDGVIVETRIVERLDGPSSKFSFRTYVWRADGLDADLTTAGATDVRGTPHDVPDNRQCIACHEGEPGRVLGFSAVQLPPATLELLSTTNRLAVPIPAGTTFGPVGAPETVAALSYLHGNCAHCHSPRGIAGYVGMNLRLTAATMPAEQEPGYLTTVNAGVQINGMGATRRIDPRNLGNSAILKRMSVRGTDQMPLLATERVDPAGVATMAAWIDSL